MKKNLTRAMSIIFALIMVFGVIAPASMLTASAASSEMSASNSVSSVKINFNNKKFYSVKNKAVLYATPSSFFGKIAEFSKNTIVETCGTYGNYYKVSLRMDGKVSYGYIKKNDLKQVNSVNATLAYTTVKNAALRQAPFAEGDKVNLSKGTVLYVLGDLVNHKDSSWVCIYYNGHVNFIFNDNIKRTKKISLTVTGDPFIKTGSDYSFKCAVSPSEITGVKWSSSDTDLASVNASGVVTPKAYGDVKITASLPGVVSVDVKTNVSLGVKAYFQTKNYTCSAASTLAVLNYRGKAIGKKDTSLYSSINGYVYLIRDSLNKYLGKNTYCYKTFTDIGAYEKAIRKSLSQNCPVILRVSFNKKYFNYESKGHYTTATGIYEKDGKIWVICVDSFANRYASNSYTDKKTGEVHVPLADLFYYNSYQGRDSRYVIYNN